MKLDPGFSLEGSEIKGSLNEIDVNTKAFTWTARLNATITFGASTKMQINGNYYAKQNDGVNDTRPFFILTASIKQDFFDKKLSLTLLARNILTTSYLDLTNTGANFNGHIQVKQEVPVVSLMLSYNFNNFKKTSRPGETVDIQTGM